MGTSGGLSGINRRRWLVYGGPTALIVASVVVGSFSMAFDLARLGRPYDLRWPFFWSITSGVVIIALLPAIRVAARLIREAVFWPRGLVIAVATTILFPVLHVGGMVLLRMLGSAIVGTTYDFHWAFEFPYELRKDLVTIATLAGAFWLIDRPVVPSVAREPEPARPTELWLRDGSTIMRVDPRDLVWVASAGNYVEFALVGGKRHLIRGTLAAQVERLAGFGFIRVHRTRLVNGARIAGITTRPSGDFDVTLDTGEVASGSRRYRDAIAARLASSAG